MPKNSFMATTQAGQVAWCNNFNTVATASPLAAGLSDAEVDAFGELVNLVNAAWAAVQNPQTKWAGSVLTLNTALKNMRTMASKLSARVQGGPATDQVKLALGLTVRAAPTPHPAPQAAPYLLVRKVVGREVELELMSDTETKGKPPFVTQATVFAHVGPTPPASVDGWPFAAVITRTRTTLPFPPSAAGDTAWISAFWMNAKGEAGVACEPVRVNLPAGGFLPEETEAA